MQAELTPWDGPKAIGITFTDNPVTVRVGLALFVAFVKRLRLPTELADLLPLS